VANGSGISGTPDQHGVWITDVYRGTSHLVGFSHLEDHSSSINKKSMAVSRSFDGGFSFETPQQILAARYELPNKYDQGLGDGCVVKDYANNRYIAFFSEVVSTTESPKISMAESKDPNGAPGTWYKWNGTTFREPGIGGVATPIKNLDAIPGAYPSVSYNTYLKAYVMVFSAWEKGFYLSLSTNLEDWTMPQPILTNNNLPSGSGKGYLWYSTLVGASSNFSGEKANLYFAHMNNAPTSYKTRIFYQADIVFTSTGKPILNPLPEEPHRPGEDGRDWMDESGGGCSSGSALPIMGILISVLCVARHKTRRGRRR
jgi:hypothetical protein